MDIDSNQIQDYVKLGDLLSIKKYFRSKSMEPKIVCKNDDLMHLAAGFGRTDIIHYFMSLEASVDHTSLITGRLPLHEACLFGNPRLVSLFLEHTKNIEVVDRDGFTPVHICAFQGELECLKLLVKAGGNLNREDKSGLQPMHWAAKMNHPPILKYLSEMKLNLEMPCAQSKTPIHYAVYFGNFESVKCLIELSCCITAIDDSKRQPVHYAAWRNHLEILKFLVSKKASLKAFSSENRTPAYLATKFGSLECLHWILEQDFDPDAQDASGNSLAHVSIENGKADCLSCVIQHGCSLNLPNAKGETALEMIKRGSLKEIPQSGNILCPLCRDIDAKEERETHHPTPDVIKSLDNAANILFKSPLPPNEVKHSAAFRNLKTASKNLGRINLNSSKLTEDNGNKWGPSVSPRVQKTSQVKNLKK